jgi:hypothetical protein
VPFACKFLLLGKSGFLSQTLIDKDTFVLPLVMETATLLDVDGDQSGYYHHKHGDEPGKFPQCDGEHDEADE